MVKGRGSPIDPSTLHRRHALEIQTLNKISTQMEVAPSGLVLHGAGKGCGGKAKRGSLRFPFVGYFQPGYSSGRSAIVAALRGRSRKVSVGPEGFEPPTNGL